ncbi:MAG: DUF1836 domain-containing protein [Gallicola sp.]|nr:DUF1836 domain-containing protein [Gallicola sp.]
MNTEFKPIHLQRWHELPDFELYIDQMIQIILEQLSDFSLFYEDTILSKSMVNNYVKKKIMPKPERKKYNKTHLSQLMVITILKPILTMSEIQTAIEAALNNKSNEEAYDLFLDSLELSYEWMWHLSRGQQKEIDLCVQGSFDLVGLSLWGKYFTKQTINEQRKDSSDE